MREGLCGPGLRSPPRANRTNKSHGEGLRLRGSSLPLTPALPCAASGAAQRAAGSHSGWTPVPADDQRARGSPASRAPPAASAPRAGLRELVLGGGWGTAHRPQASHARVKGSAPTSGRG